MKKLLSAFLFLLAFTTVSFGQYSNPTEMQSTEVFSFINATPTTPDTLYSTAVTAAGLNDFSNTTTAYTGTALHYYTIIIDGNGTPDTFKWKKDAGGYTSTVGITGADQTLTDGIKIKFTATTGHLVTDQWVISVTPTVRWYFDANGVLSTRSSVGASKIMIAPTVAMTNGQLAIGSTGASPVNATITGTSNQISVATGAGSITLSTPQSIGTASSVTFANVTDSALTANAFIYPGTAGILTPTTAAINGELLIGATGLAPVKANITGTADQVTVTNGSGSITLSTPQSINTTSSPTFAQVSTPISTVKGANASTGVIRAVTATVSGLSGATGVATNLIPAGSLVLGVVARVTTLITSGDGSTSFTIGDGTTADLWGTGIVFTAGTTTTGTNFKSGKNPLTYPSATSITLTATAGTFSAGAVELVVYYVSFTAPTS